MVVVVGVEVKKCSIPHVSSSYSFRPSLRQFGILHKTVAAVLSRSHNPPLTCEDGFRKKTPSYRELANFLSPLKNWFNCTTFCPQRRTGLRTGQLSVPSDELTNELVNFLPPVTNWFKDWSTLCPQWRTDLRTSQPSAPVTNWLTNWSTFCPQWRIYLRTGQPCVPSDELT